MYRGAPPSPPLPPDDSDQTRSHQKVTFEVQNELFTSAPTWWYKNEREKIDKLEATHLVNQTKLKDLGGYKTSARYLKIACLLCSLLTAAGAFFAGYDKPIVFFIPPQSNGAAGLLLLMGSILVGVVMSIFGGASKVDED
ncbi:MAG: hypothetical protein LBO66_03935 [Deltaproteobacteria bacterium]|jgi:hypothetical protein|nr:hypothetical protein [Deltaproteobacteria bacterium]